MITSAFAWAATMMLAAQPLGFGSQAPSEDSKALVMKLCSGGEIAIPLGDGDRGDGDKQQPHCPGSKACHAGNCRSRFDLEQ